MFLNGYPYTDFHELNLDFVLKAVNELKKAFEDFTASNSLIFAEPLLYDQTKSYSKNTIVLNEEGNAYISIKNVPAGVQLSNTEYWLLVFDFQAYLERANKNLTNNYFRNIERSPIDLDVDDWLVLDDILYRVTTAIAPDELLEVGTNIEHFTIEQFLKDFTASVTQAYADFEISINNIVAQYKNDIDASELAFTTNLQTLFNAAVAGVTVDSEILLARVGYQNITYSTLGDAIRGQIEDTLTALGSVSMGNVLTHTKAYVAGSQFGDRVFDKDLSAYAGRPVRFYIKSDTPQRFRLITQNGKNIFDADQSTMYDPNMWHYGILGSVFAADTVSSKYGPYLANTQTTYSGTATVVIDYDYAASLTHYEDVTGDNVTFKLFTAVTGNILDGRTINKNLSAYAGKNVRFYIASSGDSNTYRLQTTNGKNIFGLSSGNYYAPNKWHSGIIGSEFASGTASNPFGLYAAADHVVNDASPVLFIDIKDSSDLTLSGCTVIGQNNDLRNLTKSMADYSGLHVKFFIKGSNPVYNIRAFSGEHLVGYAEDYAPNMWHDVVVSGAFATASASTPWGVYIPSAKVTVAGDVSMIMITDFMQDTTGKNLVTIGDSLSSNTWQPYTAAETGMNFDATANTNPYAPISWGGSGSGPIKSTDSMARIKNLDNIIDSNFDGVIIFQNHNDNSNVSDAGNISDMPFFAENIHVIDTGETTTAGARSYVSSNFASDLAAVASGDRKKNSLFAYIFQGGTTNFVGSKIALSGSVVNDGDISISFANKTRTISVAVGDTLEEIAKKIEGLAFEAGVNNLAAGSEVYIYNYATTTWRATVNFGTTGLSATISDACYPFTILKYYIGADASGWTTEANWVENLGLYSWYKGIMNHLLNKYPKAKIYWFIPWTANVNFSSNPYKATNGDYDPSKFSYQFQSLVDIQKAVADLYNIELLDFNSEGGMSIANIEKYFNTSNPHPTTAGYKVWAEFISKHI